MPCDRTRENLEAFCDGELPAVDVWRVRRHVARCAGCAAELAALRRLRDLLFSADLVAADSEVPHRCAAPVRTEMSLGESAGRQPRAARGPASLASWVPAAATALLLAAGVLLFNPIGYSDPLAASIQAFTEAQAWRTCHLLVRSADGRSVREQWVRLPGALREESRQGDAMTELVVQNGRESWIYQPEKRAAVHSHGDEILVDGRGVGAFYGPLQELKRLQPEARRVGGLVIRERRDRIPDGRAARVIEIQIDPAKHYPGDTRLAGLRSIRHVVSLDAQTGRLMKWEYSVTGQTMEVVGYDQPLPDELFTWEPPADTKVVEFIDWWSARSGKKVAAARSPEWDVTIHAVDVAANGEIWLTASALPRIGQTKAPDWSAYGMSLQDERRRTYVQFYTITNHRWPPQAALIGFTPLEPRRPGDPFPKVLAAALVTRAPNAGVADERAEFVSFRGLPAPPPAVWTAPPLHPSQALAPSQFITNAGEDEQRRERGRRYYRNPHAL